MACANFVATTLLGYGWEQRKEKKFLWKYDYVENREYHLAPWVLFGTRYLRLFHSLHAQHLSAVRAVQGDCRWPLKTVEIPIGHVSQSIATEAIPIVIYITQWQRFMPGDLMPCLIPHWQSYVTRLGPCSSQPTPTNQPSWESCSRSNSVH